MNYILGQLVWKDQRWTAPDARDRFLDLRPLHAQATPRNAQGHVLIATERDPRRGEVLLLDDHRAKLTFYARDAVRDLLGIPDRLTSETLPSLVQALLGDYSDPDVDLICPPIMPDARGVVRFRLGDVGYSHRIRTDTHWHNVLKVLRQTYRNARSLGGNLHRKLLTVWCDQYGIPNYETFIPSDLPKETPLPHETTIRDNFDVGNHADIDGVASSDGGWSWNKIQGAALAVIRTDTQVYAECQSIGQTASYRADSDLSSVNHYVQADMRTESNNLTPILFLRKDSSATLTFYECQLGAGSDVLWLLKVVAGTGTVLQTNALTIDLATWYTIRYEANGSTLRTYNSGTQVGTDLVDTAITGGTRTGIRVQGAGGILVTGGIDNFEAQDLFGPNEGFTIMETGAGTDEVEYQLAGSNDFTITETGGASDSATFSMLGAFDNTLTETASATEEVEFALSRAMAITVEDGAYGDDRLTLAGAQVPYGPSMVVLKHYYLEDGRLGYSNRQVIAPSHTHDGRVTMFGTAEREIPMPPGPPRIGNMTTEMADTDQEFRIRFGNRTPRFRRSDTLIGPEGGRESLFIIPFAGVVDSVTYGPGNVTIGEVDNRFRWLRKSIPPLCTVENFPNIPQASRGRFFPILFGQVTSAGRGDQGAVELIHVDTVQHRYAANRATSGDITVYTKEPTDAEFTVVGTGWSKVEENQTIGGVDYTLCYVQFDSALPEGTIVRADVDGVNFRGGWGLFGPVSGLLQNPVDALVNLLYLIEQTEDFQNNYDVQSFAEVREQCETLGYLCDWPITEELTYEAAITQLTTSFGIHWFPSMRDQFRIVLPAVVPSDRSIFTDELHIERESEFITLASPTKNRFRYQYARLPAEGRYAVEQIYNNETDQETLANEFTDGIEEEILELPAIADETTALAVVLERSSWLDQSAHRIRVRIGAPPNLTKIDLAKYVGITHYGGLQDGGWVNEPFFIYRVALNLENLEYTVDMIKRVQPPLPPESSLVLVGQWRWNSRVGPFYIANSKRVFTIMGDTRNDFFSLVAQATPAVGTGAMTVLDDGEFPTLANVIESFDGVRFGTKHYSVTQERNTGRVAFHVFSFASSTWTLTNEEILSNNTDWSSPVQSGDCGVCIAVRDDGADGEILVIFQGEREFSSGASGVPGDTSGYYQRAYITRRISPGVWSTPQMLGDPNSMFSSPGGLIPGLDYNGAVHIRTGRAEVFPVTNNVMIAYGVVEPADVASTQDLWCQVYRTDNTLSAAFEFEYTGGGQFSNEFLVGDGCAFSHGGNNYVAMPIGKILEPYVAIWQDSTIAAMPTKVSITANEIHADNYGAKMPDINVRFAQDTLHVIFGSHLNSGSTEWGVYKTISPPFTTASPSSTAFPRADQIGPVWPANSLARTGSDVAVIGGQLRIFKLTSGHFDVPSSGGAYSIFESYGAEDDLPTASTYDLADFVADHS